MVIRFKTVLSFLKLFHDTIILWSVGGCLFRSYVVKIIDVVNLSITCVVFCSHFISFLCLNDFLWCNVINEQ